MNPEIRAKQVSLVAFLSDQRQEVTPVTILIDGNTTMLGLGEAVADAVEAQHPHYAHRPITGLRWFERDNVVGLS